ncbi:DUF3769 domain-containing protein, partial [Prochlorococcus sp. AH-736-K09]|nr:DUF3769 domain-containing protein [Prochlorococcus sp. AH-736-K09]
LAGLNSENHENNKTEFAIEIISDTQYELGNKFYAEGNVEVFLSNGNLKADKLVYEKEKNNLVLEGNISYLKGNQYVEASYLTYSFDEDDGYINNVYGVLDLITINKDLGFNLEKEIKKEDKKFDNYKVTDIKYENSANIGLENTFENGRNINISDLKFEVPQVNKWRFKADKIYLAKDSLFSDRIIFTNDPFNKPQFLLESNKFKVETLKDKLKFVSKNTWVNLDDKISFPIGRRSILDRDPITRWGIGSDFDEKDGFYIFRGLNTRRIFNKYDLKITPYFLIQRAIKGDTKSFVATDSSILSNKVTQDISLGDYFALNTLLKGEFKSWMLNINTDLNSLDFDKLPISSRVKVTLDKSFDLNANVNKKEKENINSLNKIDFQIYGAYRQKVLRSFGGDQEIYLGKGFTISNVRSWQKKSTNNLTFNYDFGEFEAKQKNENNLKTLTRNVFTATYANELPIWKKQNLDNVIDNSYKYSPLVIKQGLSWLSSVKSGAFYYGDGSQQKAVSFTTGPQLILGSFKNMFFDYTNLNVSGNFILKDGESPFAFDDIDKTQRLNLYLEQQLIGPLLLSYEGFLNLDNNSSDYGKLTKNTYALNIKRRAYSVGAFYKESSKAFGIQFMINNFNYSGSTSSF